MEAIPIYRLFNWLQNKNCTLIIDTRPWDKFKECHIKESLHCDCSSLLGRLNKGTLLRIVYILDVNISEEEGKSRCGMVWETSDRRINTYFLDSPFSAFYDSYEKCCSLFSGEINDSSSIAMCYPNEIIPGFLFLGNARQASDTAVLRDLNISHIVDASGMEASRSAATSKNVGYMSVNIDDSPETNIAPYFKSVLEFVDAAKLSGDGSTRVLIHCQAGVSRGCTFVLCYLMHSGYAANLAEACHIVLSERPWVCPNPTFRRQLREHELELCNHGAFNSQPVSFLEDKEHLEFIMKYFRMNAATFHATVFDDTPITAGREGKSLDELLQEEEDRLLLSAKVPPSSQGLVHMSERVSGVQQAKKATKPFLRRGKGKATNKVQASS